MPNILKIHDDEYSVATEQELLDFANKIRQAGGADVLEALLPSQIGMAESCLIANALNFGCSVDSSGHYKFPDGEHQWEMHLPSNLSSVQVEAIEAAVAGIEGADFIFDKDGNPIVLLPRHIGNAALAFDERVAFQSYAITCPLGLYTLTVL